MTDGEPSVAEQIQEELFGKMNWLLFHQQKLTLLELMSIIKDGSWKQHGLTDPLPDSEDFKRNTILDDLSGILCLMDNIQDIALDRLDIKEADRHYYFPDDEECDTMVGDAIRKAFGSLYKPPFPFPLTEEVLVAEIPATSEDGRPVKIYETRAPFGSFRIIVEPQEDGVDPDHRRPGMTLRVDTRHEDETVDKTIVGLIRDITDGTVKIFYPQSRKGR